MYKQVKTELTFSLLHGAAMDHLPRPLHTGIDDLGERTFLLRHDFEGSWRDIISALTYADPPMLLQQGTRADS